MKKRSFQSAAVLAAVFGLICETQAKETLSSAMMQEIAERAVREAADRVAKENADTERTAKSIAEKAAKEAAEDVVKDAAAKAAAAAAAAAAKEAAEAATKAMTDAKEAKEAEKEAREEKKAERRQIDTRIFRLNHASCEEVATQFNTMWSGEFGETWKLTKIAVAFPESNSIMVTAPRVVLEACEKAIRELDIEAQQVYIEARFVELGNSASHKVGIDWTGLAGGMTVDASIGGGIQSTTLGSGVKEYTRSIATRTGSNTTTENYGLTGIADSNGSVSYFNGTLNVSQMALTLSALDATQDAKTFSNPKIIVSSGKKATVDMTTKYPNVKISTKRTTGTSDSVDIASSLEAIPGEDKFMFAKEAFFSWGISLEVTPRIGTNGLINVSIVPTISDRTDWVETGTTGSVSTDSGTVSSKYPVIKVQRLISEFNLQSGTTAVIGGLSITTENQVDNGIPVLRDIPWIGSRFFGSVERVKEQKEIIVFVTVGLVNPREMNADAGLPKNAVLGRQYTQGQKLEPGDRPQKNMEGFDSLDMRPLEEQAKDPLRQKNGSNWSFSKFNPFSKDENYPSAAEQTKKRK